jgi:outer membrane protein assembly factor BamE (lipoprotein component of BamABCDE complex)
MKLILNLRRKTMRRWLLLIVLVVLIGGCAPWIGLQNLELGMTKAEVLQQMGNPTNASGSGSEEYLWYIPVNRFWERYYVHLVNGKVESYGQLNQQAEAPQ